MYGNLGPTMEMLARGVEGNLLVEIQGQDMDVIHVVSQLRKMKDLECEFTTFE